MLSPLLLRSRLISGLMGPSGNSLTAVSWFPKGPVADDLFLSTDVVDILLLGSSINSDSLPLSLFYTNLMLASEILLSFF